MHLLAAALVCGTTTALSPQHLRPRTVQLDDAWSVTVYEAEDIAADVEAWMETLTRLSQAASVNLLKQSEEIRADPSNAELPMTFCA